MTGTRCEIMALDPGDPPEAAIIRAASILTGGGVILYPTDTIYGLGCLADDSVAIRRIYSIKGRPESKPSLVLIDDTKRLDGLAESVPAQARVLMDRFWPGPLTIILKAAPGVNSLLTAGAGSVGIRLPAHALCRSLVAATGMAIVSTSANKSGNAPPADRGEMVRQFRDDVDLIIDGGDAGSRPSTVVDLTGGSVKVVRVGAIPLEKIVEITGGLS